MLKPIPIEKISPPSKKEFYAQYVAGNKPVVIKGLMDDWSALKLWDFKYFYENFGDMQVNLLKIKNGKAFLSKQGLIFKSAPFKQILPIVEAGDTEDSWTIGTPVNTFPTGFLKDYRNPEYCADGNFLTSLIILGAKGVLTPLHQDLPENLYATVKGKKSITLFAPMAPVYPYPRFSRLYNYSQIEVGNVDLGRFPKAANAQPFVTELLPGEMLYIPSLWWHHIQNSEPSSAINFWWAHSWRIPIVWAGKLYGKMRNLGHHSFATK